MGWCSGTEIFDMVVASLLEDVKLDKETIIKELMVQKCFKATSPELFEDY